MDQVSQNERNVLKQHGVNDIYIVPGGDRSLSDQERFEALCLLHRCLVKGDVKLGSEGKKLMSETEKKRITEAKQEIEMRNEEIKTLQQKNIELETKLHDVSSSHDNLVQDNVSLKNELKDVKENRVQTQKELAETANGAIHMEEKYKQSELKYEESLMQISHKEEEMKLILQEKNYMETKLVSENGSLKNELKGVREQKEQIEVAMTDIKNIAKRTEEMYKKNEVKYEIELRSTKLRIYSLMETVKKTEETAKQEMDRLKAEREKERAKFQVENKALKLVMKEKMESKDRHIEKLERETWKLRTKIQLESEMRSAEQKKKAEKPQSIFPWMASGKQAQTGTSKTKESSEDQSLTPDSDDLQSREESHNDAFADVLKQIADDLYDDSKIDSLGGQLGILQGNIERALKTNVKFNRFTSDGTRHMLQQWRRGVSREDERGELRRALLAAKLVDLADRHVPDETGASIKEVQAKEVKDDQSVGGENDIPVTQGDLSSETKEDTTTDLTSLQVDPSTNTNTASIIDDPSTNTNEDSTTTNDNVPLLVDPYEETNEEKAYELCCCCCF